MKLSFSTFAELGNGALDQQVQRLLRAAVLDMQNRPGEKKPRKVSINLILTPKTHAEINPITERTEIVLDGAGLKFGCNFVPPPRQTPEYDVGFSAENEVLFNPHNAHDHRQRHFPVMDEVPNTLQMSTVDVRNVPRDGRSAAAGG